MKINFHYIYHLNFNVNFLFNFLTLLLFSTWFGSEAYALDIITPGSEIENNVQEDSDLPQHYREQLNIHSGLSITGNNFFNSPDTPKPNLPIYNFFRNNFYNREFIPDAKQELTAQIFPFHLFW